MKTTAALAVLLLVLVATTTGIFLQTPGSPFEYTTVRGERALFQGSGLYRYDPAWFAREGIVWDAINLFVGLPLFALATYLDRRGSLRGRLLLGGLLFYFCYVYLLLMVGDAFNPMFLVYVAILGLSAVTFFVNLHGIDVARLAAQASRRFPRRLFIAFAFVASAVLVFLWVGRIVPIMASGRFPPELAGLTTLHSQGIDLGIVVPLMLSAGVLLWRRSPWGYLLISIGLSYGLFMFITIPAWIAVPLIQDGRINAVEAAPLLAVCLAGLALTGVFYRSLQGAEASR